MTRQDEVWSEMLPMLVHREQGFVLATVVDTSSSAPRPVGTQMVILDDTRVIGSLSGGCIEADVVARAEEVAATGRTALQDYGYSDATALGVGLTCGGSIRVFLERVDEADLDFFHRLARQIQANSPVATVTTVIGKERGRRQLAGDLNDPDLRETARLMLRERRSGTVGEHFIRSYGGPDRMVIFGSNAFAEALARLATAIGYHVTVCDARPMFTTRERFPVVDELVVRQPHEYLTELEVDHRTVLCAMTHDPKFDDPLLAAALRSPAQFIGAMGSRRTSVERLNRLRQLGFPDHELARLHAPLGLDLGASSPEETAVSMLAEIISARQGGSNLPLTRTHGPIHARD